MATKRVTQSNKKRRPLDARRDTLDFRDQMFVPTLIEVPARIDLASYQALKVPVLDQGNEGACTGFGLATVANYLFTAGKVVASRAPVSPRMLYVMARRYDEWPGEEYSGSSARGAMKGWQKHGVASEDVWPYTLPKGKSHDGGFTLKRAHDARTRPLGAYFRLNHKDLVSMHSAIAEVGILYATADVHEGWDTVGPDGLIKYSASKTGGHAFAIVAYDENGFWIQNSWGKKWGRDGCGCISYDDWLENANDVWVARLGAPIKLEQIDTASIAHAAGSGQSKAYSFPDLRPHIVSLGNDGALKPGGDYGTSQEDVVRIFESDIPNTIANMKCDHLLLYAHGGLVAEATAVQRIADYRAAMLKAGIYPLSFIWHTDYWTTISNILDDAFSRRRPEGVLDAAKDFMLDRLDDALEPLARTLTGKSAWSEMKENAVKASQNRNGGGALVSKLVKKLCDRFPSLKVHIVGHSAGSIFHGPLLAKLVNDGIAIESLTLWAPACTTDLFQEFYAPALSSGKVKRSAIFALTDKAEQDDNCANVYHKSLLYLVSNAFEKSERIPMFRDGEPLLGMQKFLNTDTQVQSLIKRGKLELVFAPNDARLGSTKASKARHHGDFDDDEATLKSTLARILDDGSTNQIELSFHRSASSLRQRRRDADRRNVSQ
jgi:hypothetical protein